MPHAKIDAVLNQDPKAGEFKYDIQIDEFGDIKSEDQLDTAIIVSLFSDGRASPGEIPAPHLRRGWIGDLESVDNPIGSKLWLLDQSRLTNKVTARASDFAQRALEWMIRDSLATRVTAGAFVDRFKMILRIDLRKPNSAAESKSFTLWENTGRG